MCGRFALLTLRDFTNLFPWILPPEAEPPARYNIAPTQAVAAVPNTAEHRVEFMHWGLIPSWAKDPEIGARMINARAESLAQKPAFRSALRRKRCIIPASGFYEWKGQRGGKVPVYITLKSGRPMGLAGLWETWQDPGGSEIHSCTVITVPPNELVETVHNRMPAILQEGDYGAWLEPGEKPPEEVAGMLRTYPAREIGMTPVSRAVNSPGYEGADCIEPAAEEPPRRARKGEADSGQGQLF